MRSIRAALPLLLVPAALSGQAARPQRADAPAARSSRPVEVTSARYTVRIDPAADLFVVRAEFVLGDPRDTVQLSLPAWTPGSYDIEDYARHVHGVSAEAGGRRVFWDKADKDTWRIAAGGERSVALEFRTNPDSLMLHYSGITRDFAWFNGTNLFVYPEGSDHGFAADVTIEAPDGWRVATGLDHAGGNRYRSDSYHDLVDSPVFAGRLAVDSVMVDGRPIRFALHPDTALTRPVWDSIGAVVRALAAAQNRIFGGPPYRHYTILFAAPTGHLQWAGGLEHHNSQFDVIPLVAFADLGTGRLGGFTASLLSHELFHLFNVKRIRPAEMWPYDYAREQYTPLLWWSEGVTDYYGDVTAVRGGVWDVERFLRSVEGNIETVEDAGEIVAVEDASTNTWIEPTFVNESQYYYPKGSLLGLMLDIQIRSSTGNRHGLDEVIRILYDNHWRRGRGFTTADLLGYIRPWYPQVDDFYARYINGREPLPYREVLARGGIAAIPRDSRFARVGVATGAPRDGGQEVMQVAPGSLAQQVGIEAGDVLLRAGEIAITGADDWGAAYRARYGEADGQPIEFVWRRGEREMRGRGAVRVVTERSWSVALDEAASGPARSILASILGQRD